jgi:hypothetical protein
MGGVVCDAESCGIVCEGPGSCACLEDGCVSIVMTATTSAVIECLGMGTCNNGVDCVAASCDVICNEAFGGCKPIACESPEPKGLCP